MNVKERSRPLMAITCISLEFKKTTTPEKLFICVLSELQYLTFIHFFCPFAAREHGESRHQFQAVVPGHLRFLLSNHWSHDHQCEGAAADRAPAVPVSGGSTDFHHQERDYRGRAGGQSQGQDPNGRHGQQSRTQLVITLLIQLR